MLHIYMHCKNLHACTISSELSPERKLTSLVALLTPSSSSLSLFDGVGSSERPEYTCRLCNWLHMLLLLTFDVKNIILIITSYDRRNTRILFSQPGTKTVSDSYRKQRRFTELDLETWIPGSCSRILQS